MSAVFAHADGSTYKGDINADGEISLADMVALSSDILNNATYNSAHDLNADKKIDDADLQELARIILNNIKSPQGGLDIGIGDWEDGGEFGGTVGAPEERFNSASRAAANGNIFSISEIKLDEQRNKYYFDITLSEQNGTVYCSAIVNISLPGNLDFSLDGNNNPLVVCNADGQIPLAHNIYGKPTLQADGSLRFIVFNNRLTNFSRASGSIARIYVDSRQESGIVTILPGELATSGNMGAGSTVTKTQETTVDLREVTRYTVSIAEAVHGRVSGAGTFSTGSEVTLTATPDEGYKFVRWSNNVTDNPYTFTLTLNTTLSALFEANTYTLTYLVDGETYKTYEVAYGANITPEPEPTKEGHTFSGWSEIPSTMPAKDVTVSGTFAVNTYTLTYLVDGETYKTYEVTYGANITPEQEPTKEGHTFSGWGEIPETMPAKDVTVSGTFAVNTYTLTYLVDGETYKTYEVRYGETIAPEEEPTKEGYIFSGWMGVPTTMPARDVTVTGNFAVDTYTLTYLVDGETYKTLKVAYGQAINPEIAPTKEGYTFSGWIGLPATMPAKDVTVTGTFTVNTYTLTYLVDGETFKTYEVTYGANITPEPEPTKEGHTFSGWSEIPSTMPAKDVTVSGTFAVNTYTLTYLVDGETYKTYELAYGEEITPEPEPEKEGYSFSGWSEIPETMPAQDVTVTGTFTIVTTIENILSSGRKVNVYNLNGIKIYEHVDAKEALRQLPKGIYIINGRKIQKQ